MRPGKVTMHPLSTPSLTMSLWKTAPGPGLAPRPREGRPAAAGVCVLAGRDLPPGRPVRLCRRPRGYLADPRDRNRPGAATASTTSRSTSADCARTGRPNGCGPLTLTRSTVKPSGRRTPARPRRTFPDRLSGASLAPDRAIRTPAQPQRRRSHQCNLRPRLAGPLPETRTRSPAPSACQPARQLQNWQFCTAPGPGTGAAQRRTADPWAGTRRPGWPRSVAVVAGLAGRGQHHHRSRAAGRVGGQPPGHLEAVEVRQLDVQQR